MGLHRTRVGEVGFRPTPCLTLLLLGWTIALFNKFVSRRSAEKMSRRYFLLLVLAQLLMLLSLPFSLHAQDTNPSQDASAKRLDQLDLLYGKAEIVTYNGRLAVHLLPGNQGPEDSVLAIIRPSDFQDGVIEADVAGVPRKDAPADARGFIGISFRVQPHASHFENLYLRPTNGRADDQLRRNHSVQYTSEPDYPWYRLRKEEPGVYESYVDLDPGAWTHMRIVVSGTTARLYINGATQPCLIVNDLKLKPARGQIAFWSHSTTDGYFSNLKIQPAAAGKPYEFP